MTTSKNTKAHRDVPVLICGAGPTGLFAAILLTKLGHRCRIIERHHEISPLSKALVIHARTMEIFAMTGILDPFLEQGSRVTELHAYIGGERKAVLHALQSNESAYSFGLFLEQRKTTAILTEALEKLGVSVDRGWELASTKVVTDEETGQEYVETVIRRAIVGTNTRSNESTILGVVELDKDEESKKYEVQTVRSEYLIATDGGKSAVRHQLDIAFPGRTLHNCIILLDCKVDSPIPLNNISFLTADDNHRIMAVFPLHDNHVRILIDNGVLTPEEHSKLDSNTLTLEMCQELVNECTGATKFILSDPTWLTYYRVNERLAEHYSVKNRVFLAGDAAHVHSPAGGQGMNTGLQDSFNLTWKMGLVLDGLAPASILSSYEVERKPVAAHVIDLSSRGINFGLAQEFWKKMMRRLVISIAPYVIPYVGNLAPNTLSMLGVRYHENIINQRHKTQPLPSKAYTVGHRAADGDLLVYKAKAKTSVEGQNEQDDVVRLQQLMVEPGVFHIVVLTSDMLHQQNKVGQVVQGIETTNASELAENTKKYLAQWRSKWNPQQSTLRAKAGRPSQLFMAHVIAHGVPEQEEQEQGQGQGRVDFSVLAENGLGEGKLYVDREGTVHERYGVEKTQGAGCLVVVRPDGYIGYRVQGAGKTAWQDVNEYFESIFFLV